MSSFCVFGISRSDCKRIAEKKVSTYDPEKKVDMSLAEWRLRADAFAESLFNEMDRAKQISPAFDAPQFCIDWINVGARGGQIKSPTVMVRGQKIDEEGVPVKRNGKPVITWLPYAG